MSGSAMTQTVNIKIGSGAYVASALFQEFRASADLRAGELFGEIAVLDGKPRLSLSQSELAEMAGGTREKVNRCLREWQRRGIIELKNRWTIIRNPDALRGLVESI